MRNCHCWLWMGQGWLLRDRCGMNTFILSCAAAAGIYALKKVGELQQEEGQQQGEQGQQPDQQQAQQPDTQQSQPTPAEPTEAQPPPDPAALQALIDDELKVAKPVKIRSTVHHVEADKALHRDHKHDPIRHKGKHDKFDPEHKFKAAHHHSPTRAQYKRGLKLRTTETGGRSHGPGGANQAHRRRGRHVKKYVKLSKVQHRQQTADGGWVVSGPQGNCDEATCTCDHHDGEVWVEAHEELNADQYRYLGTYTVCDPPHPGQAYADDRPQAWVTLATDDAYAMGAMVVGASLKQCHTSRLTHCMVTSGVSEPMLHSLYLIFDHVSKVNVMDSSDHDNLAILGRPELGVTFTKLNCWKLTQYSKCVFLDADVLVLSNSDELFDHEELSAAPDIGWPDLFNSGVFVFRPSIDTYHSLLACAITTGSFDGGDQGLLNTFFCDWRTQHPSFRLSFIYNCSAKANAVYTYASAYAKFGKDVKIVHFLGADKPWKQEYNATTQAIERKQGGDRQAADEHVQLWWRVYTDSVQPTIDRQNCYATAGPVQQDSEDAFRGYHMASPGVREPCAIRGITPVSSVEDTQHRRQWEAGVVDYLGRDAFERIQRRLDHKLNNPQ